jgi:hypothetical protein
VSSRGTIGEGKGGRAVSGVLSNRFVEDAKVFFKFAELVLKVEEDAVVDVIEFSVERLDSSFSGGQLRSEKLIASQSDLVETWSFWNMRNIFRYLKGFVV